MSLEQTMVLATYHALLVLATVSTGSTRKQDASHYQAGVIEVIDC
jgi:hypothetical protein